MAICSSRDTVRRALNDFYTTHDHPDEALGRAQQSIGKIRTMNKLSAAAAAYSGLAAGALATFGDSLAAAAAVMNLLVAADYRIGAQRQNEILDGLKVPHQMRISRMRFGVSPALRTTPPFPAPSQSKQKRGKLLNAAVMGANFGFIAVTVINTLSGSISSAAPPPQKPTTTVATEVAAPTPITERLAKNPQ